MIAYRYWILETPAKYSEFSKTTVFYLTDDGMVGDVWKKNKQLEIQDALKNGNFGYFEMGGKKYIYLTEIKNN